MENKISELEQNNSKLIEENSKIESEMERYAETIQNIIKNVGLTTDLVLDHMIENDRQIYCMTGQIALSLNGI